MTAAEKEFTISYVFKDISSMEDGEYQYSPTEEHFGVPWYTGVDRNTNYLGLFLYCDKENNDKDWSIEVWQEGRIKKVNGKTKSESDTHTFKSTDKDDGWGWIDFISWEDLMKDYVINDTLRVEFHVKIRKMIGIPKKNLMSFDESTKEYSDKVLIVEGQKFYVSKLFLARNSTVFKTLLLGKSRKLEVPLKDIDPDDFQNFLEVLHGEPAIDDDTVEGILKIAELYDSPVCFNRCEKFLMEKSAKTMVSKFEISIKFKLEHLKGKCIEDINTATDLKSIVTSNIDEIDLDTAKTVLRKFVSL